MATDDKTYTYPADTEPAMYSGPNLCWDNEPSIVMETVIKQ